MDRLWGNLSELRSPPLQQSEFLSFVGMGQPSLVHLADFIHIKILPLMKDRVKMLRKQYASARHEERLHIARLVQTMNQLDSDVILDRYLRSEKNPHIPDPHIPQEGSEVPEMLLYSPKEIVKRLAGLHSGYRITLNLSNLRVEDVLELLYDCEGMIQRLEIFNLKDYAAGKTEQIAEISKLQEALNQDNVIQLKKLIRNMISRQAASEKGMPRDRIEKLTNILHDIDMLRFFYKGAPLKARMGSDSTGRSPRVHGMGLVIEDTLPRRARHSLLRSDASRLRIPIHMQALERTTVHPKRGTTPFGKLFYRALRRMPLTSVLGCRKTHDWVIAQEFTRLASHGNVITLGGVQKHVDNGLSLNDPRAGKKMHRTQWRYLNTGLKNALKILIGFVPAFATFALTKDWWLLSYFGALIWFGITGLRNVLQSVLGGGGIRRSPLLRWNDYVKWERLADSLLFTGFSVPLLDYVAKTLILEQMFNITTATNPVALYGFMALTNGLYLCSHNIFRGLPRAAVYGNLFRSILSIPVALLFNWAAGGILISLQISGPESILQKWAAIVSKTASDLVAGFIEGLADRAQNIRTRMRDYRTKRNQIFESCARLEVLFPDLQSMEMMKSTHWLLSAKSAEVRDIGKVIIICALDLLYFWMYQPRAASALYLIMRSLSREERRILLESQQILTQEKEISLLMVEGLAGKNFSKALSFYLTRFRGYLAALDKLERKIEG